MTQRDGTASPTILCRLDQPAVPDSSIVPLMAAMVTAMLACSGPGALAHIHENIAISTVLHAVAMAFAFAALVAFAIRSRRYGRLASTLVLAGLHPAWWVPAYSGDCGEMRLALSFVGTATCAVLALSMWKKPAALPTSRTTGLQ